MDILLEGNQAVMIVSCERCLDMGLYRDWRCIDEKCAHRERRVLEWKWVTITRQDGTTYEKQIPIKFGGPIMTCPTRTCVCSAGKHCKRRRQH